MHEVGDPVYSNSYGFGYISKIDDATTGYTRYYIEWVNEDPDWSSLNISYQSKGIDSLKMFLRMKLRGEDI